MKQHSTRYISMTNAICRMEKITSQNVFCTIMTAISKYQKTTQELSTTILEVAWKKIQKYTQNRQIKKRNQDN